MSRLRLGVFRLHAGTFSPAEQAVHPRPSLSRMPSSAWQSRFLAARRSNALRALRSESNKGTHISERILLSETLALSGNSSATSLQRMACPAFKTRFKTVFEILSSPAGPVRDLTWSRDGKLLVTASEGGGIRVWRL